MKLFLQPRVESAPFLLSSILGARGYFCLGEEANEYSKKRKKCICLLFEFSLASASEKTYLWHPGYTARSLLPREIH